MVVVWLWEWALIEIRRCDHLWMRRLAILATLVLSGATLSACTPADQPVVALAVRDGEPVGVLVTCPGSLSGVRVYRDNATDRTLIRWAVSGWARTEVVEVPLLGAPPEGFEVDPPTDLRTTGAGTGPDVEALTELTPGLRYSLTGHGAEDAIAVDFSPDDYARIGPDQVLVPGKRAPRVMSRTAFLDRARDNVDC